MMIKFFTFNWLGPLGGVSYRVAMSVCLSMCLSMPSQNTHFRVSKRLLVEECVPKIGLWSHNFQKKIDFCLGRGGPFFSRLLKFTVLDQPTVDNGGVSMGRSVAVTVGCWLLAIGTSMALHWHFIGTLTTLQRHFNDTSTEPQQHFNVTQKNATKNELNFCLVWPMWIIFFGNL